MGHVGKVQRLQREADKDGYRHPGVVVGTRDLWHLLYGTVHKGPGSFQGIPAPWQHPLWQQRQLGFLHGQPELLEFGPRPLDQLVTLLLYDVLSHIQGQAPSASPVVDSLFKKVNWGFSGVPTSPCSCPVSKSVATHRLSKAVWSRGGAVGCVSTSWEGSFHVSLLSIGPSRRESAVTRTSPWPDTLG